MQSGSQTWLVRRKCTLNLLVVCAHRQPLLHARFGHAGSHTGWRRGNFRTATEDKVRLQQGMIGPNSIETILVLGVFVSASVGFIMWFMACQFNEEPSHTHTE